MSKVEPLVSAQVAARRLGVPSTELARSAPHYRVGGARLFRMSEVRAWLEQCGSADANGRIAK